MIFPVKLWGSAHITCGLSGAVSGIASCNLHNLQKDVVR